MTKRRSLLGSLSKWCAGSRTKWVTLACWVLLTAFVSLVFPSVSKEENNDAALLPTTSSSVEAQSRINAAFPGQKGTPALIVFYDKSGLSSAEEAGIQTASKYLTEHPQTWQESVSPLYQLPSAALKSLESNDHTTLVLPVSFASTIPSTSLQSTVTNLQKAIQTALVQNPFHNTSFTTSGLHARVTGPIGIATDAQGLFQHADVALLAATTLLVLVLLILIYRSPVLALVPLVSVGFAYGVTSPILGILAKSGGIVVDAQGVSIMTVLLFGAGTDYCLFLVTRYRERLFHVRDKHQAIHEALGGSAGAILMSGITVVLSLLTLLFTKYGSEHRFAVPFSLAIFVMALVGVTLVPALLAILGRGAFYPFVPRTAEMLSERAKQGKRLRRRTNHGEPGRFSSWMARTVANRPWVVASTSVLALIALASFSTQIKTTYNLLDSFPQDSPSRQGYSILAEHFSPGSLAPVQLLVESQASIEPVRQDLTKLPVVQSVSAPRESQVTPGVDLFQVTLKDNPYSEAALDAIPTIRTTVERSLTSIGVADPAQHIWIGGETATQYDTRAVTNRDTWVVIPLVIAIIAVLLFLYLRSLVAMIYLILTVVLSYFSALGIGWLVLHQIMGSTAIQGAIPLYAFVFLVALGEDYNIFMVSRIWQERHTSSIKCAIEKGVSRTSGVITSAGLILAGTFAVLASLPIQVLVQFGIVTAIGVLLDTFIVRPFVVPAITEILGNAAFWPGRHKANGEQLVDEMTGV